MGFRKVIAQKILEKVFVKGSLQIVLPDGDSFILDGEEKGGIVAHIELKSWRTFHCLFMSGVTGLGEAYMQEFWSSEDLSSLLKFGLSNRETTRRLARGRFIQRIFNRLQHSLRRNSIAGSRKNIAHHYDLGNQFYALWLDSSMTYSSALFSTQKDNLVDAQENKYRSLCDLINMDSSSSTLEIGCGWGGFIEYVSNEHGSRIEGITISKEQFKFVKKRIENGEWSSSASVKTLDYRLVGGRYDKIVSIEMIEAVGEMYWHKFFEKLKTLLKPHGSIGLQLITIDEAAFSLYRKYPDFIQKYIFPGGMLMTKDLLKELSVSAGLQLVEIRDFGSDYARTLRIWKERFNAVWPELEKMGFEDRFRKMWNFYLSYCEAGFDNGLIDVSQVHLMHAG